ncbi:MAG TPA: glycine--tRNA ligase subunit beta, partial [bacterium]|nr:glycine--tRNA ligase subunit beta [bacterium]
MKPLLIELGCEELPAGVAKPAVEALREKVLALLREHRLEYGTAQVFHAPRRLALLVDGVSAAGTAVTVEKTGPSVKAAYAPDGKPTKAAEGFARGAGVTVDRLFTVKTDKGEYLAAKVELPAVTLPALLAEKLPELLATLPFPKNMRWNATKFSFSRPLRWLVVLHDTAVLPVQVAGLTAGRESRGHRQHSAGTVTIARAADYCAALRPLFVIPDAAERRALIEAGAKAAAPAGGTVALDAKLLDEVADLVEYPFPFRADFDARYLAIPTPVLVGAMKKHQRYFPVYDAADRAKLLPCFIGVANGDGAQYDLAMVREGNNRVLRARFEDAEFFYKTDTAKPLADYGHELDRIMYEKTLGSIGDRVRRIDALVTELVKCGEFPALTAQQAHSVARLCKADLATKMVFEFTELQGVIGSEYAAREKYDGPVARGIAQHYWPTGPECAVPAEVPGALVALADKFDAIAGGFATGKEPTGSADPYALRRAALGIVRILARP